MRVVDVRTLAERLAEFLDLAAAGETVRIVDGDVVVAELRPAGDRSDDPIPAPEAPATRRGPPELPRRPVAALDDVLRELREDRDAR
jgi:antitoxin (DNA-binding transcriptional repressor) of toxin-antitoxin stability system